MVGMSDRLDMVIGGKPAELLAVVFDIGTVEDLLRHYPRRYVDGMTVRDDDDGYDVGEHVTFVDDITGTDTRRTRKPPHRTILTITLGSGRRAITATFFNAHYLQRTLTQGKRVLISGEISTYRDRPQLAHPEFLLLDTNKGSKSLSKIVEGSSGSRTFDLSIFERDFFPIYAASSKLQSWDIYACVRRVLDVLDPIDDPMPEFIVRKHNLMSEDAAIRAIHLAESEEERERARERLIYDEAIGLQWALVKRRNEEVSRSGPSAPRDGTGLSAKLEKRLPFELTTGQREVLEVLRAELADSRPMNRLLQGEVGSGKTIIALLAMTQMIDAGYQCALLAPTEVLAVQHLRSIETILGPLGMGGQLGAFDGSATRVTLLTGSMTAGQKRAARAAIASGEAGIVIGTHALLQDTVTFHKLGLVVIDEQHRFGVEQRDQLRNKAPDGVTPHLLVMTATPIPRTIALIVYGDLDVSTLRELPRGRQPITTQTIFVKDKPRWLDRAWQRIVEEVDQGRQAFIVAPRIDEDDKKPAGRNDRAGNADGAPEPSATVEELFAMLHFGPLSELRLGLMHGRLPSDEKDAVMRAFSAGEINVLVSTTVIEVGVDVPNATMMVVVDADRFGISQLHQLRGRIGRGSHPSLCLLTTKMSQNSTAGLRLKQVAATLDGFTLADLDLEARSEGDVLGQLQAGRKNLTLSLLSLAEHRDIIEESRQLCETTYAHDPGSTLNTLAARFTDTGQVDYLDKS
ncbi:MAG: ATP-dependent DNA helicase RecG [Mycobacterium sp.]